MRRGEAGPKEPYHQGHRLVSRRRVAGIEVRVPSITDVPETRQNRRGIDSGFQEIHRTLEPYEFL